MKEELEVTPERRESERLARYGLKPSADLGESLVVDDGQYLRLSAKDTDKARRGRVRLEPKSLDDVKRWIGVPDKLGAKRPIACEMPAEIPNVKTAADLRKVDPNTRRAVQSLAHEYVFGDSHRVVAYKPLLELVIDRPWITGWFFRQDIDIHNGAVLEIGGGTKILYARHIRIWVGGTLKISGAATIDCVSIQGNYQGRAKAVEFAPELKADVVGVKRAPGGES